MLLVCKEQVLARSGDLKAAVDAVTNALAPVAGCGLHTDKSSSSAQQLVHSIAMLG